MPHATHAVRRSKRNVTLAAGAVAITWLAYVATPAPDIRHRLSMATAYTGLIFLALSMWLGPWNVLRGRSNPVSFDLRRDIGIWAAILAIVHTAIGLTVHLRGRMWMYFFHGLHPLTVQNTKFGFANFAGLAAVVIFVMLLGISNDFSLCTLKARRWKSLQRWTYLAVLLTGAHGIAYQLIEKRQLAWMLVYSAIMTCVAVIQFVGFVRVHRRNRVPVCFAVPGVSQDEF